MRTLIGPLGLVLLLASLPAICWGQPVQVILYPGSGQVTERISPEVTRRTQDQGLAVFTIPAQADPNSAQLEIVKGASAILDIHWERIEADEREEIVALRAELDEQVRRLEGLQAGTRAVDTEVRFWESQAGSAAADAGHAERLASTIHARVNDLLLKRADQERRAKETGERIGELRRKLEELTGDAQKRWQGVVTLGGLQDDAPAIDVSYVLSGCGWTPLLRLDGVPRESRVEFSFDAEIWQSTGAIWDRVDLSLATLRPRQRIDPPGLPAWIVQPRPMPMLRKGMERQEMMAVAPEAAADMGGVREEERATFSLYRLGTRTLPPGDRVRLTVRSEQWPATFTHLLRPAQAEETFVQAQVKLDKAVQIPSGSASYHLDGALLGKRPLDLAGRELTLSFGSDPLVTGREVLVDRTAGSGGIFGRRQTHLWDLRVEAENKRGHAIDLVVEEALPQGRHESVAIEIKAEPEFTARELDRGIWALTIEAGGTATRRLTVRITAPEEMELDLGKR
jgi:uncharacterized protein (TIGR02231 family)